MRVRYVILSLLLHAIPLLLFLSRPRPRPPIELTPLDVIPQSRRGGAGGGRGGGRRSESRVSRLSMRDLLPAPGAPGEGVLRGGDGSGDGSGTFDAVGLAEYAPLTPFFEALWRRIDEGVGYPQDFSDNWIEGRVWVKLVVDGRGVWRDDFLRIEAESAVLKSYVLAALSEALRAPLPERVHAKRERLVLQLEFDFSTYRHPKLARKEPGGYARNALWFKKEVFAPGRLDRAMSAFYRKYFPPIIPLPGGFMIDFVRVYQIVTERGAPDIDVLRQHRLTMLREKIAAALHPGRAKGRER